MLDNFDFSLQGMQKMVESEKTKKWEKDDRFWKLSKNEEGTGMAVIRLMIDKNGKDQVKMFHYSMQKPNPANPKKPFWLFVNSPETIGEPCPVKDHYMKLMAEGTTEAKEEAKKFKRQTKFISNIMVVKDPANPENEGKIFLMEYGTKLRDKFTSWINPSQDEIDMGEEPKNLFSPLVDGYDIKLKIQKQGEFFTYDGSSVMSSPRAQYETREEAIKAIKNDTHDLEEFKSPGYYKTYEEIQASLDWFLGNKDKKVETPKVKASTILDEDEDFVATPKPTTAKKTQTVDSDDEDWLEDL